jgi:ABC-type uncharacterized transport system substrate-binding protein
MAIYIGRRKFLAALGGAAAVWPLAARAQQPRKVWRVGMLQPGAPPEPLLETIKDGMRDLSYVEGRDIVFEVRWAEGKHDRLGGLAAELVGLKVDVIHAFTTLPALAARGVTTTIPIVFSAVGDPVGVGLVASLARPGGNATGLSALATELSGKRLEVLREVSPNVSRVAMSAMGGGRRAAHSGRPLHGRASQANRRLRGPAGPAGHLRNTGIRRFRRSHLLMQPTRPSQPTAASFH